MNTVIKGTKTIAEYKRVREDMENLARANYARHKEAFEDPNILALYYIYTQAGVQASKGECEACQ